MNKEKGAKVAQVIFAAAYSLAVVLAIASCSQKEKQESPAAASPAASAPAALSKGVGPVQSLELGALDEALAAKGQTVFSGTCAACHKLDARYVGPALSGVTKRRAPEWIMNMILNPAGMTQSDETAKALLGEYMTQMSVNVTQDDARALLEYFRKLDGK
jgi:mono/diheme cytochrome c family protein